MNPWRGLAAAVAMVGCRAATPATSGRPSPVGCQPVDSIAGTWRAAVFIDGARVGDHLRARREAAEPEVFELTDPDPVALAALRPETIDLLQFVRGPEAETAHRLCPGYVAVLVTTKPSR